MQGQDGVETLAGLMDVLRSVEGLQVKGKTQSAFYFKSKAFLHFHGHEPELTADVRFGDDWERMPARTIKERLALIAKVRAHVGAGRTLPSR